MPGLGTALVVEGNGLIAMDAGEMLLGAGFAQVEIAATSSEALDWLQSAAFDFVLFDATVADWQDGAMVAELQARKIPLAFSCSYSDGSDIVPAGCGAAFITKPYSERDMHGLIRSAFPGLIVAASGTPTPLAR